MTRSASTGRLSVNGIDERQLVNQYPPITIRPAPGKPKHFTTREIADMVKIMKVA